MKGGEYGAKKKTARPVSRSRRFARTFSERSSHSPRGAAGHNPLRDREWPVNYGIPARHHHPRGTSGPCAWTFRIGLQNRFPVSFLPSRRGAVLHRRRLRYSTPEAHQQLSPPRETLRSLSPSGHFRSSPQPNFVRRTISQRAARSKRRNRQDSVDWRDNEDGFARTTIEGGGRPPDALNPAPP